ARLEQQLRLRRRPVAQWRAQDYRDLTVDREPGAFGLEPRRCRRTAPARIDQVAGVEDLRAVVRQHTEAGLDARGSAGSDSEANVDARVDRHGGQHLLETSAI